MAENKKIVKVGIMAEFNIENRDAAEKLRAYMIDFIIDNKSAFSSSIKYGDSFGIKTVHKRYPEQICFMCEGPNKDWDEQKESE